MLYLTRGQYSHFLWGTLISGTQVYRNQPVKKNHWYKSGDIWFRINPVRNEQGKRMRTSQRCVEVALEGEVPTFFLLNNMCENCFTIRDGEIVNFLLYENQHEEFLKHCRFINNRRAERRGRHFVPLLRHSPKLEALL